MTFDSLIRVDIKVHGQVQLKVEWTEGDVSWLAYFVDRAQVVSISSDLRNSLTDLVLDMKSNGGHSGAVVLNALARYGKRLYEALFRAVEGRDHAAEARDWVESRPGFDRVAFRVEDRIHVPWGLIFDGDPNLLPQDGPGLDRKSVV